MRTALLPIAALLAVVALVAVAVRESRRLVRPPAAEAATDLGES